MLLFQQDCNDELRKTLTGASLLIHQHHSWKQSLPTILRAVQELAEIELAREAAFLRR
jgi:hypothetical protein